MKRDETKSDDCLVEYRRNDCEALCWHGASSSSSSFVLLGSVAAVLARLGEAQRKEQTNEQNFFGPDDK